MKERFIIIIPYHFEFYKSFKENLEQMGYEVVLLFITDRPFRYKNPTQKIYNLIQKSIFGNKRYKEELRIQKNSEDLINALSNIDSPVDYTLVIRADFLNSDAIARLKEKTRRLFAYQWDGYKRSVGVKDLIHFFDRFFVFDTDDYKRYNPLFSNIEFITNFYLDNEPRNEVEDGSVFFIGRYLSERANPIFKISELLNEKGIKANINIVAKSKSVRKKLEAYKITLLEEPLSYQKMFMLLKSASYILDFENAEQNGLTFRVFESLFFQKKLITNNPLIKGYDFYHPNNIFVWDEKNIGEIEAFLNKPYKMLDKEIISKYSCQNWIKNIIGKPPYIKIKMPGS